MYLFFMRDLLALFGYRGRFVFAYMVACPERAKIKTARKAMT